MRFWKTSNHQEEFGTSQFQTPLFVPLLFFSLLLFFSSESISNSKVWANRFSFVLLHDYNRKILNLC